MFSHSAPQVELWPASTPLPQALREVSILVLGTQKGRRKNLYAASGSGGTREDATL